jgi:hypothetical protein
MRSRGSQERRRRARALICAAVTLFAPALAGADAPAATSSSSAPSSSAAELERDARKAYEQRQFAVAARGFEAANRAAPHAELRYNAALSWELAGDPARAADGYEAALAAGGLGAEQAEQARKRLAKLDQGLGVLVVEGPPGAALRVDGELAGALPARVHAAPGDHDLAVTLPGGEAVAQRAKVAAGETRKVTFPASSGAPTAAPSAATPEPSQAAAPSAAKISAARTAGWITLGAGVALAGAAIGLGAATLSARDDFVKGGDHDASLHDRAITLRALTNAAWVGAGVAAVAGGAVLFFAYRTPGPASASVHLSPGSAALRIRF